MNVLVVAGALICLMLSHERQELFGGPSLGLEIIVLVNVLDHLKFPVSVTRIYPLTSEAEALVYIIKLIDDPPLYLKLA